MDLLPFQKTVLEEVSDSDGLLVLARGLGLRAILANLLQAVCSPPSIVILLNASQDEDRFFSEELGSTYRTISHELPVSERQILYAEGGIASVTSRILIVDLLSSNRIQANRIAGIIVLHAEHITPTSTEAFIIRVFRSKNRTAFIKAFSDNPEHFTYGLSPLQTCMSQLKLRNVFLWPRFHVDVQESLSERKADVVELHQPLSPSMDELQTAIVDCLDATVTEIKRHNISDMEADDINVENALFRSFDAVINARFEPYFHKISPKTRQLIADMTELRRLLYFLLSLDCVSFYQYLETILASNSSKVHKSPWLFMDSADTIFKVARKRVIANTPTPTTQTPASAAQTSSDSNQSRKDHEKAKNTVNITVEDDDGSTDEDERALIEVLDQAEREHDLQNPSNKDTRNNPQEETQGKEKGKEQEKRSRPKWLPDDTDPVLEEQPKWHLLGEIMDEIEQDIQNTPFDPDSLSKDTILIMCNSQSTCSVIKSYLSSTITSQQEDGKSNNETRGYRMLRHKLKNYYEWKAALGKMNKNLATQVKANTIPSGVNRPASASSNRQPYQQQQQQGQVPENPAFRRKAEYKRGQQPSNKRRRVRGGASNVSSATRKSNDGGGADVTVLENEARELAEKAEKKDQEGQDDEEDDDIKIIEEEMFIDLTNDQVEIATFDEYFGICAAQDLVVVRPYIGDEDDRILCELQPKYIIMLDPDPTFIRRVECFRSSRPGQNIRVYFLIYADSAEEQLYLSGIRREKESFEKLIKENSVMAIPLEAEHRPGEQDESELLRTVSSRIAGGRQALAGPPKVIVDMREFRSSLPSLLHAAKFEVIPLTLIIGDYVLSPNMVVERKSVPDLVQSFNSGRLYQQCELMSIHYRQPILLIEFEERKGFTLDAYAETKPANTSSDTDVMSKLVLLTLSFPRLRIVWSSSPSATANIFSDLKQNHEEPDADKAAIVGSEDGGAGATGNLNVEGTLNQVPQDILRSLPGITTKNYRYVMRRVPNLRDLVDLPLEDIQELIGNEPGRTLYSFLHQDVRSS